LKEKDHYEDLDIDGMIMLKLILDKWVRGCGEDSSSSRQGPVAAFWEHSYESLGLIMCLEFVVWLSSCWLLKED
jgi:hypothetical protein